MRVSPFVSPLRADLHDLPPTLLVVPGMRPPRRAERRHGSAPPTRPALPPSSRLYAGASHSFLEAVSIAPLADRALSESAAWLAAAMA